MAGMKCEYRATHEFGADGCCNLCFKARLVAEKEEAALHPKPEVKLDEPQVQELPTGWNTSCGGALGSTFYIPIFGDNYATNAQFKTKLAPMAELSQLEATVAGLRVRGVEPSAHTLNRITELRGEYYPYTKAGQQEQAKRDEEYREALAKQDGCSHRMLQLSECGYEGDCLTCGKLFDEVDLDNLRAERAHLDKVQLKASARLTALLAPALFGALEKAAATEPDGETIKCECGWKGGMISFISHRKEHG